MGPTTSGFLVEHVGFRWTATAFAGLNLVMLVVDVADFSKDAGFARIWKSKAKAQTKKKAQK
jgi:hypothetical protein